MPNIDKPEQSSTDNRGNNTYAYNNTYNNSNTYAYTSSRPITLNNYSKQA